MQIHSQIIKCINGDNLTRQEALNAASQIMTGKFTSAQIGAFLTALKIKGETTEEITGFALAMRQQALKLPDPGFDVVDTCGTGGDGRNTFNISTVSAFVAAGAGCYVAKHGNRSISSKCGSADLFQKLDINIELNPQQTAHCLKTTGIGFLFAPLHHQAMKYVLQPRRELGVRTIFNILGPLTNPAGAKRQLIGVYDISLVRTLAEVLAALGSQQVMIVHAEDGLDEISISAKTRVAELKDGNISEYTINPEDFGFTPSPPDSIVGGEPEANLRIALDVLEGKQGPARDIVLLNAGAVIYTAGLAESISQGIEQAVKAIDSGQAMQKVDDLRKLSQHLSQESGEEPS